MGLVDGGGEGLDPAYLRIYGMIIERSRLECMLTSYNL